MRQQLQAWRLGTGCCREAPTNAQGVYKRCMLLHTSTVEPPMPSGCALISSGGKTLSHTSLRLSRMSAVWLSPYLHDKGGTCESHVLPSGAFYPKVAPPFPGSSTHIATHSVVFQLTG